MTITRYAPDAAVAAAGHLAASAGLQMLDRGGNAADAAIAAAAAMAVTGPHMCGLGGDLFALVVDGGRGRPPRSTPPAGPAPAPTPARLRGGGRPRCPSRHDIRERHRARLRGRLVALHERFGTLPLADLLAPARRLAADGFPVSPTLAAASAGAEPGRARAAFGAPAPLARAPPGRCPGLRAALARHRRAAAATASTWARRRGAARRSAPASSPPTTCAPGRPTG